MQNKLTKVLRGILYVLPMALIFSYHPVISLGADETMNFELSVPLVWLVVFDAVVIGAMLRRKVLFSGLRGRWAWVLFPLWLTASVAWSLNPVRGVLTVGILWLLYIAGYGMWSLREEIFGADFRGKWGKWFFGAALVGGVWCIVQCILDLVGVSREYSLMCAGCTYSMFGFPHPNGFAIEPQFMGNLLLAPAMVAMWVILSKGCWQWCFSGQSGGCCRGNEGASPVKTGASDPSPKNTMPAALALVLSISLFLTFSRGAIYAFLVGMMVMSLVVLVRTRGERGRAWKRVGVVWGVIVVAAVVAVNAQGLMAEVSPTNDTYQDGVAKVVNHMSLGVIDLRGEDRGVESWTGVEPVENLVENFGDETEINDSMEVANGEEAAFDGYVAESTDARVRLTESAVRIWSQDFKTALFGVGLGGAGRALYDNGLSPAPKEIVQNQYTSLLLETGVIGVMLLIVALGMVVRVTMRSGRMSMLLGLIVAYGVSVCFFSGLPNALHMYLLPIVLAML